MGKEAKIGLGIILILLVVLGVVLARRLSAPADDLVGEGPPPPASPGTPAPPEAKMPGGPQQSTAHKLPTRPTVVEARADSTKAGTPPSPQLSGRWSVASDPGRSDKKPPEVAKAAPPTFMPKTAPEPSSAMYDRYRTAPVSPRSGGSFSGEAGASDGAGSVMVEGPAGAAPAPPTPTTSQHGYDPRYRTTPHYTPAGQLIQPTRQTEPDTGRVDASNPLRGPTVGTATGDRTTAAPTPTTNQYAAAGRSTGGYSPSRYMPGGYTTGTDYRHAQPGTAASASPGYAGTAPSGYRPPEPAARSIAPPPGPTPATMVGNYSKPIRPEAGRRADGTYVVQPNDSYWIISERLYGSGNYFKALAEHNRDKHPQADKLDVGDVILAPTREELEQTYADLCPTRSHAESARRQAIAVSTPAGYMGGRVYEVQQGDTLYDIAKWELGKTARWTEIYDLNRDTLGDDHDHLTPGLKLRMPGDAPSDVMATRPGTTYER